MIVKVDTYRKPKSNLRRRKPRKLRKDGTNHYKVRSASLTTLGFASYKEYLRSDLWLKIRSRIMTKYGGKCASCNGEAYTVHHVTYSVAVLAGKEDSQLLSICRSCHYRAEFQGEHKRVDATSVHKALSTKMKSKPTNRLNKSQPMCRCCRQKKKRPLGRDGICLSCYKTYRGNVHAVAKQADERAMLKVTVPIE